MHLKLLHFLWSTMNLAYSYFTISFIYPILKKGLKRELNENSALEIISEKDKCNYLNVKFDKIYKRLYTKYSQDPIHRKSILKWTLIQMFWPNLLLQAIFVLIEISFKSLTLKLN